MPNEIIEKTILDRNCDPLTKSFVIYICCNALRQRVTSPICHNGKGYGHLTIQYKTHYPVTPINHWHLNFLSVLKNIFKIENQSQVNCSMKFTLSCQSYLIFGAINKQQSFSYTFISTIEGVRAIMIKYINARFIINIDSKTYTTKHTQLATPKPLPFSQWNLMN